MTEEERIKAEILSRHESIRQFAMSINMSCSTLDSILKRGLKNASVRNVMKIYGALEISADGSLSSNESAVNCDNEELLRLYRCMNSVGKEHLLNAARLIVGNPAMKKESFNEGDSIERI